MEYKLVHEIGEGNYQGAFYIKKRILLINSPKKDYMSLAHSYYSKEEKKQAKLNYKNK